MRKVICLLVVSGFTITGISQRGNDPSKEEKQKSSFYNETGIISHSYGSVRKGKRNFRDSLYYLIERFTTRPPQEHIQSDIVYIDYDMAEKKLRVPNTTNSVCKGYVEKLLLDENLVKLIRDSATTGFILPVFFMTLNDERPFGTDDDIIISTSAVQKLLEMFAKAKNKEREIWDFVRIVSYNTNKRKTDR